MATGVRMNRMVATTLTYVCLLFVSAFEGAAPQPAAPTIVVKQIIKDAPKIERIAVDDRGRIYVVTPQDNLVGVHDLAGAPIGRIGAAGNGSGELSNPGDLATGPGGTVWVVDRGNNRLQRFDRNGRVTAQVQVSSPLSVAVGPGGALWVVTTYDRALMRVYDPSGTQTGEVGEPMPVSDMPGEQEAYLSRGRVFAFDGGLLYMFAVSLDRRS